MLSGQLGVDFSTFDPTSPLAEIPVPGIQGVKDALVATGAGEAVTGLATTLPKHDERRFAGPADYGLAMSDTGFGDFEFERKFFVRELPAVAASDPSPALIVQSYLFAADGYAVRVRVQGCAPTDLDADPGGLLDALGDDSIGTMTAKGPAVGGTRYEAERELDPLVAAQIVRRADHVITKIRYSVWLGEDGWIIDRFLGVNAPLLLAEVERGSPVVNLAIPAFCAAEVSEDDRFRNEYLAHHPYDTWADAYLGELDRHGPTFVDTLGHNHFDGG
jgi:adenylate cyclase